MQHLPFLPKSFILNNNCLFKLFISMLSPSTNVSSLIPELTKYWLNGQPIPPTPTIIFNFDNIFIFVSENL